MVSTTAIYIAQKQMVHFSGQRFHHLALLPEGSIAVEDNGRPIHGAMLELGEEVLAIPLGGCRTRYYPRNQLESHHVVFWVALRNSDQCPQIITNQENFVVFVVTSCCGSLSKLIYQGSRT